MHVDYCIIIVKEKQGSSSEIHSSIIFLSAVYIK